MQRLVVEGGQRLSGAVTVHGAKNATLPVLAAALLPREGESVIGNLPALSDVRAAMRILEHLGCAVTHEGDRVRVDASGDIGAEIPDALMGEMRSSIVFLGSMLARTGRADVSHPGGCSIGARPINLHLQALQQMGMLCEEEHGRLRCRVDGRLRGGVINLPFPSVGATENVLLAAATAQGVTTLRGAAREPEIADLCAYLRSCGARITDAGDGVLVIEGVERLRGAAHQVIPDRIEAATYMAAAAVTGGSVVLRGVNPAHVTPVFGAFEEMGCTLATWEDSLLLTAPERLRRVACVRTMPHPGFPTDAMPLVLSCAAVAQGTSMLVETIFETRFGCAGDLGRMGADIKLEGRLAVVEGVRGLWGAGVRCPDLRGGAALVIAALAAQGRTEITELAHLDRGYEALEEGLRRLGGRVERLA